MRAALAAVLVAGAGIASGGEAWAQLAPGEPTDLFSFTGFVAGLTAPTDIAILPDGRAVITQKGGDIVVRRADGTIDRAAGQPPGALDTDSEKGLLGVVADPAFLQNRTLYFYVSNGPDSANKHRVYKATLDDDGKVTFATTPIVD